MTFVLLMIMLTDFDMAYEKKEERTRRKIDARMTIRMPKIFLFLSLSSLLVDANGLQMR